MRQGLLLMRQGYIWPTAIYANQQQAWVEQVTSIKGAGAGQQNRSAREQNSVRIYTDGATVTMA